MKEFPRTLDGFYALTIFERNVVKRFCMMRSCNSRESLIEAVASGRFGEEARGAGEKTVASVSKMLGLPPRAKKSKVLDGRD